MATSSSASSFPSARLFEGARMIRQALLCTALLALVACDALEDDDPTTHVRAINFVSDSPRLKFYFDTTSIAETAFLGASNFNAAAEGSFNVGLKVIHPANINDKTDDDAVETDIGTPVSLSFAADKDYVVFATGTMADPQLFVIETTGQRDSVEEDKAVWQIVNTATTVQSVDVYITAPQAGIMTSQFFETVAPQTQSSAMTLSLVKDPGSTNPDTTPLVVDVTIELRAAGTDTVLFKSGKLQITEKSRVTFAIGDNPGPGASAVRLINLGTSSVIIPSPDDGAAARFANVSPDSPALDVVLAGSQAVIGQNVAFRGVSPYVNIPNGENGLFATVTGTTAPLSFIEEFSATQNVNYTAYAIGLTAPAEVDAYVIADDRRSVPTQSRFRFINASPALSEKALDIYVMAPGTTIKFNDNNTATTDTPVTFGSLGYLGVTDYLTLEGAGYDLYAVLEDTTTIVLGPVRIDIANGSNRTYVLTDSEAGQPEFVPVTDAGT